MPGSPLHVRSRRVRVVGIPVVVVQVCGDVDADSAPILRAALLHAVDHHRLIHCDLGDVGFFGAAGVNTLAAAGRRAVWTGSRLELCGVHGLTRRVLVIAGLDRVLPISE